MERPTVYIRTYGCQMNERDSEAVAASLRERGYRIVDSEDEADVVLVNTCSVRDRAEQKALGKMGLLGRTKRERPNRILGFMGCMAQARGPELLERVPEVDLVVGTRRFQRIADLLDRMIEGGPGKVVEIGEEPDDAPTLSGHLDVPGKVTAFVSIMQGCDQFCTFCIVPRTRGRERSRPIREIVDEVRTICERGVREVTLLGQIVTSYGWRENGWTPRRGPQSDAGTPFVRLLEALHEVPGLERIRFTAPHPAGVRDDLIEAVRDLPRVCEQVHLPAQSGSDRILRRMRRGYTAGEFTEIADRIRDRVPGVTISTDLIVGFPGETEEDFEATLRLVERVRFDHAYVFKYSPRKGTPAASMEDQVPGEERVRRHALLLETVNRIGTEQLAARVGGREEILVEGPSRRNPRRWSGRTRGNHVVILPESAAAALSPGDLVDVEIRRSTETALYGEPVAGDRTATEGGD